MKPGFLDRLNLCWIWLKTLWPEIHRWHRSPGGLPRTGVYYGFDRLPKLDEKVFGGIVKIQDLQRKFPNQRRCAAVLYLVSSALPYHPVRMAVLAARSGAKVVLNQNGVAYPGWYGEGWELANRPMMKLLHMSDYVFYQSRFCKDCADRFLETRKQDFEILPNPVDTSFFTPPRHVERSDGPIRILMAGSYQSFYRIRTAFECLRHLSEKFPGIRLLVAGRNAWQKDKTSALKQAERLARRLEIENQVDFLGPYTQSQAPRIFRSAHLLLHTKVNDPCPRLVVEAMSCGLPVVYSNSGGVPELVGSKAGIGVSGPVDWTTDHPPDPVALADAVSSIAARRTAYAAEARKRAVEKFDVHPWIERHQKVFSDLSKPARAGATP